jgi:hypothetical protein
LSLILIYQDYERLVLIIIYLQIMLVISLTYICNMFNLNFKPYSYAFLILVLSLFTLAI